MSSKALKSATPAANGVIERRAHLRYKFAAAFDLVANGSSDRSEGQVSDLNEQGCYVDTNICFPIGTLAKIRIVREGKSLEAQVKVIFAQSGKGMGLLFSALRPAESAVLEGWIAACRETSWLAANRRRSQRILMQVPVRISTPSGATAPFEEDSTTMSISAHGALILMSGRVKKGQRLILSNIRTESDLECIVAYIGESQGARAEVGVAFVMSSSAFWHVTFPPPDWTPRHGDAKQSQERPAKG
jgi:hypothetical protein